MGSGCGMECAVEPDLAGLGDLGGEAWFTAVGGEL